MQKISMSSRLRKQAGFTMVELSVVLVVGGLLIAAVVKGQEMVDVAKSGKMAKDLQNVGSLIQQYSQLKGRLPGDCNADGVIDVAVDTVDRKDTSNSARADLYDYTAKTATYAADGAAVSLKTDACPQLGVLGTTAVVSDPASGSNVWINDLKIAGLISEGTVNRLFAKQVNEDFMFVGNVTDAGNGTAVGASYNAVVLHNVPVWMARSMALAINGNDVTANAGRLRQLTRSTDNGTYSPVWDQVETDLGASAAGRTRDAQVSIAYFFDRIPAAGRTGI